METYAPKIADTLFDKSLTDQQRYDTIVRLFENYGNDQKLSVVRTVHRFFTNAAFGFLKTPMRNEGEAVGALNEAINQTRRQLGIHDEAKA